MGWGGATHIVRDEVAMVVMHREMLPRDWETHHLGIGLGKRIVDYHVELQGTEKHQVI